MNKLKIYLVAIKNNVWVDRYFNKVLFKDSFIKVVAPTKFNTFYKKFGILFNAGYVFFLIFLPLIVAMGLTFKFIKDLFRKITRKIQNSAKEFNSTVLINTQPSLLKTVNSLNKYQGATILTPIFISQDLGNDRNVIWTCGMLKYSEILGNYCKSLLTIFSVPSEYSYRDILYSLNSYDWFNMYDVLNHYLHRDIEIVFSNQKDRWSVLYDHSPQFNKVLIQHGTNIFFKEPESGVSSFFAAVEDGKSWVLDMPYKYAKINKLISFSELEAKHLLCSEFSKSINVSVSYMGFNLDLKPYHSEKPKILIIGNSDVFFDIEKYIFENLDLSKFEVLLKPHPVSNVNSYSYLEGHDVTIIDFNANVDLVISYNSTLAYGYEDFGITVRFFRSMEDAMSIVKSLNSSV